MGFKNEKIKLLTIALAQIKYLCLGLDIWVSEVVEPDMLQPSVLQNLFVEFHHRVRVVHFACDWRGEHVLVVRVLAVLLDQQVDSILRDGHLSDGCFRLWPGEHHLSAGIADVLLANGDRLAFDVQVCP